MTEYQRTLLKRLAACLFGGFVLALMVGTQEGSQDDFGIAFHRFCADWFSKQLRTSEEASKDAG